MAEYGAHGTKKLNFTNRPSFFSVGEDGRPSNSMVTALLGFLLEMESLNGCLELAVYQGE